MVTDADFAAAAAGGISRIAGRFVESSNSALLVECESVKAVFKPQMWERPLWDFPQGTISHREVVTHTLDRLLGFGFVPPTLWLQESEWGSGSLQLYIENAEVSDVAIFSDGTPEGWHEVAEGEWGEERVWIAHKDLAEIRLLALFDCIINNGDRKAGHILRDATDKLWAIDHGVCLNADFKLRTVLWGWQGQPLLENERQSVEKLQTSLMNERLEFLHDREIESLALRLDQLLDRGFFEPSDEWPAYPWPIF